jgi:hypothetical protein
MYTGVWKGNLKERDQLGDSGIDGRSGRKCKWVKPNERVVKCKCEGVKCR